ncbi:unnamed protein product [Protopolystoma xenopodis]|uniref:Uncharacterized protein n=1 Tax=Protopolystoma xenopodis TaxID=117903 RepID=A0A448X4I6_9PLAT|nr:unnamed protein product [Protopolystoma xenopodis]
MGGGVLQPPASILQQAPEAAGAVAGRVATSADDATVQKNPEQNGGPVQSDVSNCGRFPIE